MEIEHCMSRLRAMSAELEKMANELSIDGGFRSKPLTSEVRIVASRAAFDAIARLGENANQQKLVSEIMSRTGMGRDWSVQHLALLVKDKLLVVEYSHHGHTYIYRRPS